MSARPNILLIIADQLAQQAVGCYGCPIGSTPNIDALAAHGTRFDRMYCNAPLCAPSRASFWTGRYPHQTGIISNGRGWPCPPVAEDIPTVGSLFHDAGYTTAHFGKTHDGGTLRGFDVAPLESAPFDGPDWLALNQDTYRDVDTTRKAAHFLEAQADADTPFLAVADLNNPHNICGWVGAHAGPGPHETPEDDDLPALPANFETPDIAERPKPVQYVCCAHRRQAQAQGWPELTFRQYIAAYHHYVRMMDAHIGTLLQTLDRTGQRDDTLVIFMSDHGDGIAAHRMVTKHTTFYEETNRIPFIMNGPGVNNTGGRVTEGLGSLIDLLPTLCDVAGIDTPAGLPGRSLLPWFRGERPAQPHAYVVSQWHTEWGYTVEPGRMIRTARHKYTRYREGDGEELFDLDADPGEMRTLIHDPHHRDALEKHRALLQQYTEQWHDPFFSLEWTVDERWRAHAPGVEHHTGPSAPEAAGV